MTDDSIKQKALALLNGVIKERRCVPRMTIYRETNIEDEALCRAIEQHEAYKQKVSDIVWEELINFIIPKEGYAAYLRTALEARELERREKNDG